MTTLGDIPGMDELFDAVPSEFVKRRNALAKELKASGEAEAASAASAVSALKRPSGPVWAINQLARRYPDEVERYLEIQSSLATVGGGGRLNELATERRKVVGKLMQLGESLLRASGQTASTQTLQRIGSTLLAADDAEEQEAIRRGLLTEELTVSGFGGMTIDAGESGDDSSEAELERRRAEEGTEAMEAEAEEAAQIADRLAEEAARLLRESDAAAAEAREARKRADELAKEANSARAKLKRR